MTCSTAGTSKPPSEGDPTSPRHSSKPTSVSAGSFTSVSAGSFTCRTAVKSELQSEVDPTSPRLPRLSRRVSAPPSMDEVAKLAHLLADGMPTTSGNMSIVATLTAGTDFASLDSCKPAPGSKGDDAGRKSVHDSGAPTSNSASQKPAQHWVLEHSLESSDFECERGLRGPRRRTGDDIGVFAPDPASKPAQQLDVERRGSALSSCSSSTSTHSSDSERELRSRIQMRRRSASPLCLQPSSPRPSLQVARRKSAPQAQAAPVRSVNLLPNQPTSQLLQRRRSSGAAVRDSLQISQCCEAICGAK